MSSPEFLVTLNVAPDLEEAVVDCLLTLESEHGFSSLPVYSHDHRNVGLSLAEQVTGRQRKIRFQMYLPEQGLAELLDKLRGEFSGSGISYRVSPVLDSGVI
ncbi:MULTISPECIES: DUF3240 family protein [Methylotuvimicrobium]|uniref:DUF3240 domain-containing protein n=2 Tax=Methylotuvimicrobium TaxID=2822410 RepID=G4STP2_META2|nr:MULTISPECIES: DUF3240 family protein [Methylotuvimicrobium]QCW80825.1 DUF3240 domain-containing protein [Methylotuvimicrobium buryatense]CCE21714.1 conserved protein of unknown function [Methylotuvimicrobium alcaliphilum 20Z]